MFKGGAPSSDWIELAIVGGWAVYALHSGGDWFNIKVAALQPQPRKANFCFGWNTLEKRVAGHRDALIMAEYHPELMRDVRTTLEALVHRTAQGHHLPP